MFVLITSYYLSSNPLRQQEIDQCLKLNYDNTLIDKIILLNDRYYDLDFLNDDSNKIYQHADNNMYLNNRLIFKEVFNFINEFCMEGDICIVCNSDIYIDYTIEKLFHISLNNTFFALSRYDEGELRIGNDSQDTWIFSKPLKLNIQECDFTFGVPGCDNALAYIALNSGYNVINPCLSIKTHHLHASGFRTYNSDCRIRKPYYSVNQKYL